MTAAEQDWVQQSLARLEHLESHRMQLEQAGQTEQLAEIDEEIASLYEVLETVAEDAEPAAAANPAMAPVPASAPVAAPASAMAAPIDPFAAPAAVPADPFGPPPGAPAPAPMIATPDPSAGYGGYDDLDDAPKSKTGLVLGLVGLLVVGGGVAAYVVTQQAKEEKAAPVEDKEPGKVLQAGEIPADTQEPDVAKGADVDRSLGTKFKESPNSPAPRSGSNKGSRNSGSASRAKGGKSKKDDRSIDVAKTSNDPLAGVD